MTEEKTSRTLADQVGEAYLRASRWSGYPVRVELEDGTIVSMRHLPEPGTVIHVESVDHGHGADFRLSVTATQLPPVGPEDDGALRAELAAGVVHAGANGECPDYGSRLDPCPPGCASGTCVAGQRTPAPARPPAEGEHPGPGLVVALIRAAMEWYPEAKARDDRFGENHVQTERGMIRALETLMAQVERDMAEESPGAGHWEPGTWAGVKAGDRVRLGEAEAMVSAALPMHWHTDPSSPRWPRPLEHDVMNVVLEGWNDGKPYGMKPSGPVDIWRPALDDWAAQAFVALGEASMSATRVVKGIDHG